MGDSDDYMEFGYTSELSLFKPSMIDSGVQKTRWIPYKPVTQMERGLEFVVNNNSSAYIDLSRTTLNLQVQVLKEDGTVLPKMPPGLEIKSEGNVGPVNLFHSSLFQQVDVYLQDKLIGGSNNNYAYKAMIDVLLGENLSNKSSNLQSQLYYKDAAFGMDDPDAYLGQNFGLKQRAEYIKESRVLELEGPLYTDISQLSRFMLNNVDLKFVLWQSSPEFHLMCGSPGKRFRTKILNATLNVCHVYVSPHILIAHARVLAADHPAIYPFKRSEIKRYVVSAGSYSFSADDVFLAQVPNQIVLAMVEAQSVAGSYSRNPFNFKHFRTNYISLQVNGENTPSTKPLTTKFSTEKAEGTFLPGFLSLQNFKAMSKGTSNDISRLEYSSGYTMMCYDLDQMASNDPTNVKALSRSGNVRCEIIFDEPLETSINVIFYAQYDSEIRIDKTRSVEIIH